MSNIVVEPKRKHRKEQITPRPRHVVSLRALAIGTLLIPLNCYWMAVAEVQWNSVDATCVSLFFHVVFLVFLLALANKLLALRFPNIALTPAEILVIYIMLSIASAVAGRDTMENLLPVLGHPFWFANEANGYSEFFKYIPSWLAPRDEAVLKGYYLGGSSIYDWTVMKAWLPTVAAWSVFIISMLFVMLCINVIVRRHWMDQEKLTFPTVFLPIEMARDQKFFSNRMLWVGFLIPFVIQNMNGLHHFFPAVPFLNLKLQDMSPYLINPPWNAMGWTPISFYPFAIGMSFLLPLDLSFSCWFFYIVRKMEAVVGACLGYKSLGAAWPMCREQGTGAWIGLCLFLLWSGRKYYGDIVRTALGIADSKSRLDDSGELLSYRTACLGLLIGALIMFVFCISAGMSPWLPPIYLAIFFVLSIVITRIRAELGPPAHELNWVNPEMILVSVLGTHSLGVQNLTALSYMFWFNRGYRSHPMPHQLEGMKIGRDVGMEPKRLLAAMVIAGVVATFAAFWALLSVFYQNGEATANIQSYSTGIGSEAFSRLSDWSRTPRPTDFIAVSWMGIGFGFTFFLMIMKSRFYGWPFHPAGYALANSYALEYWWMTILIGWFLKLIIVRYGGIKGYRSALPFFLGLILGDYVCASLWSIVGWILGVSVYRPFIF